MLPFLMQPETGAQRSGGAGDATLHREPRLDAGGAVAAHTALVAAGGVQVAHVRAGGVAGVVRALPRVARLAPPVALQTRVVQRGLQPRRARRRTELHAMRRRESGTVDGEEIVAERVGARIGAELREREARVRHLRAFAVTARAQRQRLPAAEVLLEAQRRIRHIQVDVLARAIAVLAVGDHPPARADGVDAVAEIEREAAQPVVAALGGDARFEGLGRARRDVVHQPADGLRAEGDLPSVLQHLDPLEALEGRVVVGGVVAVGREGERQAVLEQQHLGGARGVETPDADVGPQAEAFFVAGVHARDLAQRLVDREHARVAQVGGVEHLRGAGKALRAGARADHHHLGQGLRALTGRVGRGRAGGTRGERQCKQGGDEDPSGRPDHRNPRW